MKNFLTTDEEQRLSQTIQSSLNGLRGLGLEGTPESVLSAARAKGWNVSKIEKARNELVDSCYAWALHIASKYQADLDREDIFQAALLGLMRAALRFVESKGKWSTYCTWWIRQSIKRTINNDSRLIRVPAYLCSKRGYTEHNKIVGEVEIPVKDKVEIDLHGEPERLLTEREMVIFEGRFLTVPRLTLKEIGEQLNLSRERIRQIERQILVILSDSKILKDEYDSLH